MMHFFGDITGFEILVDGGFGWWVWMMYSGIQLSQSAKDPLVPESASPHHHPDLCWTQLKQLQFGYSTTQYGMIHIPQFGTGIGCYLCPRSTVCRPAGTLPAA